MTTLPKPKRPTRDETWMGMAQINAQRSNCSRRKVGAIIVDARNRVVATGYNGPPAGYPHTSNTECQTWCDRARNNDNQQTYNTCVSVHAETNALLYTSRDQVEGGTLYVTSSCCWDCTKIVANSGIKRVVMQLDPARDKHRDPDRNIKFLQQCGLEVTITPNSH